jgi:hypothetical protein
MCLLLGNVVEVECVGGASSCHGEGQQQLASWTCSSCSVPAAFSSEEALELHVLVEHSQPQFQVSEFSISVANSRHCFSI